MKEGNNQIEKERELKGYARNPNGNLDRKISWKVMDSQNPLHQWWREMNTGQGIVVETLLS